MDKHYDVFLSHANADKLDFVDDLKKSFDKLGISVFYDKDSIGWGDKWKEKIFDGLQNCDFGIIVISDNFFGREWTEIELKELLSRQNASGQKFILPILYKTSLSGLKRQYKQLADIQFLDSSKLDVKDITIQLASVLLRHSRSNDGCPNYYDMFDMFFDGFSGCLDFYDWLDKLISNDNQFVPEYDPEFIGWQSFEYNGKSISLFQNRDSLFRINPIYYDDLVRYFEEKIRPQM